MSDVQNLPDAVCIVCRRMRFDGAWAGRRFATITAAQNILNKGICWDCKKGDVYANAYEALSVWGPL